MDKMMRIALYAVCIVLVVIVGSAIVFLNRPMDSYVTIESIQAAAQLPENHLLAKIDDEYYEIASSEELASLFEFEKWEVSSKKPAGKPMLTLRFAELWMVDFYADGLVSAHNGYASVMRTKDTAVYVVPVDVAQVMIGKLERDGIPHIMGDGIVSVGTFRYR